MNAPRPLGRRLSPTDQFLSSLENGLRTLSGANRAQRPSPASRVGPYSPAPSLSPEERRLSAALMRVNHVGEVCAQALYQAQALTARDEATRQHLLQAAAEETDHLAWCEARLTELHSRTSLLNPLWFAGAFGLGLLAGRLGDAVSLGFVSETERQVEAHLAEHLERLPAADDASKAIVTQMKADEAAHGQAARDRGGVELPAAVQAAMKGAAKVMTTTAHYL